jgi:Nuclease-related domain/UvrD-like helicase C-terminal domain
MYPGQLPDFVESSAERLLYKLFEAQLPDNFIVMHSVKWLIRDRRYHDHDGEIDFLIIHQEWGLLVLEVKGGRIRIESGTGRWYTKDRFDQETQLKTNPFKQAERNLYSLKKKLAETPKTRPFSYRFQRGIALPDVNIGHGDIGLYGNRELIIDSTDLSRLESAVRCIMGTSEKKDALSDYAIKVLVDTLQPSLEIHRFALSTQLLKAEDQIATLTENQFAILDTLQLHPQAAISGCAGSGKTMLAMEKARRLANEDFRVLFTCFNKYLAQWVRDQFRHDPFTIHERISVAHYHELARELCRRAGIPLPPLPRTTDANGIRAYFDEVLPQKLVEAISKFSFRFDAIIADEGQDFAEMWWITLLDLSKDRERGVFYIFYDNNQRIYARETTLPFAELPYTLNLNCRNTARIHEQILHYYQGDPKPRSRGPEGTQPEFVPIEGDERETLRGVFARLFTEERIPHNSVVILTPRSARTSRFKEGDRIGNVVLTWEWHTGPGQIQMSSIHSFKGLESPIVVLVELDKLDSVTRDYLLYVALSRPRDHLIVLGKLPEPGTKVNDRELRKRWLTDEVLD